MTAPRDEHAAARAGWAAGPWATYGVAPEVWREVADQHAERGALPTAAQVDLATRCGTGAALAAIEAFALYHELGALLAAGSPAAARPVTAPGALYLDPADGELVQVLPATAWDPERWGPATAGLTVCRVLASAPRHEATGEVVQRDLGGCLLLRDAAGRVPAALRALAGAAGRPTAAPSPEVWHGSDTRVEIRRASEEQIAAKVAAWLALFGQAPMIERTSTGVVLTPLGRS